MYHQYILSLNTLINKFEDDDKLRPIVKRIHNEMLNEYSTEDILDEFILALNNVDDKLDNYDAGWNDAMEEVDMTGETRYK